MQILQVADNSTLKCYYQLNVNVIKKVSQIIECDTFFLLITSWLIQDVLRLNNPPYSLYN